MTEEPRNQSVRNAYTKALLASQLDTNAHGSAELAGYGLERDQFSAAASSSFGCGNPLAFSAVKPGDVVLDLGSGAGLDLLIASERVGAEGRVIGVDMTEAMIDAARTHAQNAGAENVELRLGTIEDLPAEDRSVDWVISNCVINLSDDKPKVFSEIARVLKPGGRFSISDLVVEELPSWIRDYAAAHVACVSGALSESQFLRGLGEAGLVDVDVADRLLYDATQLKALVGPDLVSLGVAPEFLEKALGCVDGKVWSARFVGGSLR